VNLSGGVLIVTEDAITGLGLKTLLAEYHGVAASYSPAWTDVSLTDLRSKSLHLILCDEASLAALSMHSRKILREKLVVTCRQSDKKSSFLHLHTDISFEDLNEAIRQLLPSSAETRGPQQPALTPREIEVLKLLAQGYIIKEIADRLSISVHTVLSHRNNISDKLGIKTIPGLTVYATINGYISAASVL